MSTIGKKPLVDVLLESLDNEKLKSLKANLDTNYIVDYDDFVDLYKNGVLGQVYAPTFNGIYIAPYLLNFEPDEQHLVPYLLNSNGKLDKIDEKITILELRSALADRMIEAGAVIPENVKFTVTNIKTLTDSQCEDLKAGDIIAKKTGNQYHTYVVSYNEKNHGLCLTYSDASIVETVSYDKVGGHWIYNSTDKSEDAINEVINESLLSGTLKTAFQAKTFAVSDFPLTSDIDNQHATVNEGKLPDGNMSDLTESQINRLVVTLNRIINKGWLKTSTLKALKLTSVMYDNTIISIVANSIVFNAIDVGGIVSGFSYLITLDIANASYSYSYGSYNIIQ